MFDFLEFFHNNSAAIARGLKHANTVTEIAGKIQALARASKSASDPELEGHITALIEEAQKAKLANLDLKELLIEMREEALAAKEVERKLGRYELWQTPMGASVYRLKADSADGDPIHYCCPVCFENEKISILQGNGPTKSCKVCDNASRRYKFTAGRPWTKSAPLQGIV